MANKEKIISVRLPDEMVRELDKIASNNEATRSRLIRLALAEKLGLDKYLNPWSDT